MSERELQRAFARVILSSEIDPGDLEFLGGPAVRWQIYREMVRGRFFDAVGEFLPRTRAALSSEIFAAHLGRWLAESPPRTRYVRELAHEFGDFLDARRGPEEVSPRVADLLRYERAILHAVDAQDPAGPIEDFEMHRIAVFAPSVTLLRARSDVVGDDPRPTDASFLVYRNAETYQIETLALSGLAADVTEAMRSGDRSVTASAQAVMATIPEGEHQGFAQMLVELLGDYLDRGVIVGSRATT